MEGEETYAALERIRNTVARFYDYEDIYLVGNSTSDKDLSTSFGMDNTIITVLTGLFAMIILLFTFQSSRTFALSRISLIRTSFFTVGIGYDVYIPVFNHLFCFLSSFSLIY